MENISFENHKGKKVIPKNETIDLKLSKLHFSLNKFVTGFKFFLSLKI